MKQLLFLSLLFIAGPAFGQVITLDESLFEEAQATTTLQSATTTVAATTTATTSVPTATTTEITESITIVPGGLTLKLSQTVPVTDASATTPSKTTDEGIFGLIYTGFEEFVFKVFGV